MSPELEGVSAMAFPLCRWAPDFLKGIVFKQNMEMIFINFIKNQNYTYLFDLGMAYRDGGRT